MKRSGRKQEKSHPGPRLPKKEAQELITTWPMARTERVRTSVGALLTCVIEYRKWLEVRLKSEDQR